MQERPQTGSVGLSRREKPGREPRNLERQGGRYELPKQLGPALSVALLTYKLSAGLVPRPAPDLDPAPACSPASRPCSTRSLVSRLVPVPRTPRGASPAPLSTRGRNDSFSLTRSDVAPA